MRGARLLWVLGPLLASAAALAQSTAGEYRVGPRDLLEIRVLEAPELNLERRVSDNGQLDLPIVGQLAVTGMTSGEIKDRLVAMLTAKYTQRANVSIIVKEYASKPVSVLGAVLRPGSLTISGRWDLQQAILAAGGLAPNAGRKIFVLRKSDSGLSDRLEVDSADLFQRASGTWNVPIFPSDIINVPPRTVVKVFCLGELKAPGAIEFDSEDRMTLLSVIAKAGGLTDRAARGSIKIKRRLPDGRDVEVEADYRRIVSGKDKDPEMKPDDVVVIKESLF